MVSGAVIAFTRRFNNISLSAVLEHAFVETLALEFDSPILSNETLVNRCSCTWIAGVIIHRGFFDGGSSSSSESLFVNKLDNRVKFIVGSVAT